MYRIVLLFLMSVLCSGVYATDVVTEPFVGVTHIHRTLTSPRPLNINIVIIDLTAEGLKFRATPPNGDALGETNAQVMTDFISGQKAQIAINCGFFAYGSNGYDVMGYAASDGVIYSHFADYSADNWPLPYAALNITSDNVPRIITPMPGLPVGSFVFPMGTSIYNAVPGSEWIIRDGVKSIWDWDINRYRHPRTAAGYTRDNKLILLTVDGRQTGFSEGMYTSEVADLLLSFDVYQGINFDGGGSTAMAFADPYPRLVNVPIDGGVPYKQRPTPSNLAVYAQLNTNSENRVVYSDFEDGNEGTFTLTPGYSGSTEGIIDAQSTATAYDGDSWQGGWCEKIVIKDDPAITAIAENPDGGWFVRWISGSGASPSQNYPRPVDGYVGFWVKTQTPNLKIAITVDNDLKMERGVLKDVIADGFWHCYQWSLDDNSQWQGWYNGDGQITGSSFTIDSVQILGPDADAELYIDTICHDIQTSVDNIDDCGHIWKAGQGMLPDLNHDCLVDEVDLEFLIQSWLQDDPENDIVVTGQGNKIDMQDVACMAQFWLRDNNPQVLE